MKKLYIIWPGLFLLVFIAFQPLRSSGQASLATPDTATISSDKVNDDPGKFDPPPPFEVSTSEFEKEEVLIGFYPNPCTEEMRLVLSEDAIPLQVTIFSLTGKRIMATTLHPGITTIEVAGLKPGIYILHTGSSGYRFQKI